MDDCSITELADLIKDGLRINVEFKAYLVAALILSDDDIDELFEEDRPDNVVIPEVIKKLEAVGGNVAGKFIEVLQNCGQTELAETASKLHSTVDRTKTPEPEAPVIQDQQVKQQTGGGAGDKNTREGQPEKPKQKQNDSEPAAKAKQSPVKIAPPQTHNQDPKESQIAATVVNETEVATKAPEAAKQEDSEFVNKRGPPPTDPEVIRVAVGDALMEYNRKDPKIGDAIVAKQYRLDAIKYADRDLVESPGPYQSFDGVTIIPNKVVRTFPIECAQEICRLLGGDVKLVLNRAHGGKALLSPSEEVKFVLLEVFDQTSGKKLGTWWFQAERTTREALKEALGKEPKQVQCKQKSFTDFNVDANVVSWWSQVRNKDLEVVMGD